MHGNPKKVKHLYVQELLYYESNKVSRLITWNKQKDFAFVMDINNGEVLSMSSLPDFVPNKRSSLIEKNIFNLEIIFSPATLSFKQ